MPIITVQGTPIDFPDTSASPNWSPAIITFAQAVATAVNGVTGTYDIPAQTLIIDNYNPGSNITIPNLAFADTQVRGAFIRYTVYRTTSTTTVSEVGDISVVYNPANPTGNLWEISPVRIGNASITFSITDSGQMQFTTSILSGTGHSGVLTYAAQSLQQS